MKEVKAYQSKDGSLHLTQKRARTKDLEIENLLILDKAFLPDKNMYINHKYSLSEVAYQLAKAGYFIDYDDGTI